MFKNAQDLIAWIESQKRLTPKVSLERFKRICELYGSPEKHLKYIHIGGTNGKGSTVAFVKNILLEAGYNVATYISPYVIRFNERIAYNDEFISDEDLLEIGNYIISKYSLLEANNLDPLSFFEFVTLTAFIYFSRLEKLDFVVLEVGLGGLLDATNIVKPLVTVITNVSYDHMNVLGDSLEEIAKNKLGIVKAGVPLITSDNPELRELFQETCQKMQSPLVLVKAEDLKNVRVSLLKTVFDYKDFKDLKLSLLGRHQALNAALAFEVILELRKTYPVSRENIYRGLAKTFWPGRLQVLSRDPVILVDGAHNLGGMVSLAEFLHEVKGDNFLRVVFAVSHDKAKDRMLPIIETVADEMVFTRYSYYRSDDAHKLYAISKHPRKRVEEDLDSLILEAKAAKGITVFCGSLFFVSDVLHKFSSFS